MHGGGLCDCLAIMGLCLINHVDPLCFTSKAAALGLINGDQSPFEKEIGYRLSSSEYTGQQALIAVMLWWTNRAAADYDVTRYLMTILFLWRVRMTCCCIIYNLWTRWQSVFLHKLGVIIDFGVGAGLMICCGAEINF